MAKMAEVAETRGMRLGLERMLLWVSRGEAPGNQEVTIGFVDSLRASQVKNLGP